jgi:hypothetical protein
VTLALFDVQAGFGGVMPGKREVYSDAALRADMQRLQIGRALVRITPEELDKDVALSNRMLYDACRASQGTLVPCPVLLPASGGDFPKEDEQVAQAVASGAGAGVLRPGPDRWDLAEWSSGKLLAAMEDRRLPAFCLARLVSLPDVGRLAAGYPRLPIIVAEVVYRDHRLVCGLLESFPNVLLSMGSNYTVHGGIEDIVKRFGAGRLLFGTGAPRAEPAMAVLQLVYADIPDVDRQAIGSENLDRLIGGIRR